MRYIREIICIDCSKEVIATSPRQIRCGSSANKTGCSYKKHLSRRYKRNKEKDEARKASLKEARDRILLASLKEKYE